MTAGVRARQVRAAMGLPRLARLSWARLLIELKQFTRNPGQVFFTFSLPVLFLLLFGTIFGGETVEAPPGERSVKFIQYFVPGIIAAGAMSTTFTNLALSIAVEQHEGLLKRLAGTPLPRTAYFAGKLGMAAVTTFAQTGIMLAVAVAFYDVSLPPDAGHWAVFASVLLLGVAACSLLGIAYTRMIPNASSAAAIVQPPFLILQFISGVFFPYSDVPAPLQAIASAFPLKWMAEGLRYAFVPPWLGADEYGRAWEMALVFGVLAGWVAASFVLALLAFRWNRERV